MTGPKFPTLINRLPNIKTNMTINQSSRKHGYIILIPLKPHFHIVRASINFQTQEVHDFLPLKFGSPTGKSRKSHFFSMLRRSALSLVE